MKKILLIFAAVAISLSLKGQENTYLNVGDAVPDFTVEMLDGSTVKISDLRGKVVLINFWATWCPYCIVELDSVQQEIVDRFAGQEFVFIAISRGEEKKKVERFAEKKGYKFNIGLDTAEKIFPLFAETGIPRNYLVGRDGVISAFELGYTADTFDRLVKAIDNTLKTK